MQRNFKIGLLAPVGFGIVIGLTVLSNLLYQWSTDGLITSVGWVTHTYKVKEELANLEKLLVDAETGQRGFLYSGREEFLEPYNRALKRIKNEFFSLESEIKDNPAQIENLSELEEFSQQKLEELASTIALKRAGKERELRAIFISGRGKQIMDNIRAKIAEMRKIEEDLLEERQKSALQAQALSSYLGWGSMLAIVGVGIFISWAIARIISRSLGIAVAAAERVASGDLTGQIEVTSNDEIGKLLASLQTMTQNLNLLLRQVQQSGIQVTSSATQIAASGRELEAMVKEQAASTNEVVATAKEIAATSGQLVHTMDEVALMAQSTTTAAGSGQKDLVRMEAVMRQLAKATVSISSKLGVISEKANNINSIVTTITQVADRTNLLSLNAAIEAEKAGEYGLGFAVVAKEIRRLADQTSVATLDIESMVKEMQSAVSTGVMEMDKFTKEVSRGVKDVRNISVQLAQVIEQVQSLTPRFTAVNQGMEAQSIGAMQISEAMMQLSEASSQTAGSLREINSAIEQLNEAAIGLRQEISRFQVKS